MKTYNVTWSERHSVNVEAESEQEAVDAVLNSEYDAAQEAAKFNSDLSACEINEQLPESIDDDGSIAV